MSPENNPKDENFISSGRKADQVVKCPRCDSPNTKFCYYNNYSLSQPRHFCKTCRRYWTKGGALRNVPIGGGCRKNKKVKSSLRFSGCVDSKESGANSDNSEFGAKLGFFNGHSPATMDFNLGTGNLSFSRIDPFGVFPAGVDMNIASSIESLSSLNQNLHWKLQQQRLTNTMQPILFQNLEISKPEVVCDSSSAVPDQWFFGNSYAAAATATHTMTDNIREDAVGSFDSGGGGFDGVQEWNDLHQFSHLP